MAKKSNQEEGRYGITHAFEIATATTLGKFEEQLRQHTEQIGGINVSFSAMNLSFAQMESDIHDIKAGILTLRNPSISLRTVGKIVLAVAASATTWELIRRTLEVWGWAGSGP